MIQFFPSAAARRQFAAAIAIAAVACASVFYAGSSAGQSSDSADDNAPRNRSDARRDAEQRRQRRAERSAEATGAPTGFPTLRLEGDEEKVYGSNSVGCREPDGKEVRNDHSDQPAHAFRDYNGQVHMLASSRQNFLLLGPSLNQVARRGCEHTVVSNGSSAPETFDQFQWLMSVYTDDGRTVYGLTHHEFHGDLTVPECRGGAEDSLRRRGKTVFQGAEGKRGEGWTMRCWYTSVNLVVSRDGGFNFLPPGGKARPMAQLPYRFASDMERAGPHSPTNIVKHPTDGRYYVMIQTSPYRDQARGTCVARATDLQKADWRAWGGSDFDISFVNPYASAVQDPARHVCATVVPWLALSLSYNTQARAFLMIGYDTRGAIYSWSNDLVRWTPAQVLLQATIRSRNARSPEATAHYSALDPNSAGRNFDQTGANFFLYFTRYLGGSEGGPRGWQYEGRELVRRRVAVVQ